MNQHIISLYKELKAEGFTNVQIVGICRRFLKVVWTKPHGETYQDLMLYAQQQEIIANSNPLPNYPIESGPYHMKTTNDQPPTTNY